jgi:hypothetical protein
LGDDGICWAKEDSDIDDDDFVLVSLAGAGANGLRSCGLEAFDKVDAASTFCSGVPLITTSDFSILLWAVSVLFSKTPLDLLPEAAVGGYSSGVYCVPTSLVCPGDANDFSAPFTTSDAKSPVFAAAADTNVVLDDATSRGRKAEEEERGEVVFRRCWKGVEAPDELAERYALVRAGERLEGTKKGWGDREGEDVRVVMGKAWKSTVCVE